MTRELSPHDARLLELARAISEVPGGEHLLESLGRLHGASLGTVTRLASAAADLLLQMQEERGQERGEPR